ncbi:MAG: hypothetical protein ABI462_10925, partial [Ignavibacteria bacterium]
MDFPDPKTILVVQIGKIGDMILTTPLFTGLKKLFPDAILKVLASNLNKDIPLNHCAVNEVIVYRKSFLKNIFLPDISLRKIDMWIDPKDGYSRTSELLLKMYRPEKSIGFNFKKKIFDISLNGIVTGTHAVDINVSPLSFFESQNNKITSLPSFTIPIETEKKFANTFQTDKLNVLINVSAGNNSRYLENNKW